MVIEKLPCPFGGELRSQTRGLLPAELPVVGAPNFVRPTVAIGDSKGHATLGEHLLECSSFSRTRVRQCVEYLVAERLFKPAGSELFTTQFPIRLGLGRIWQYSQAFVTH